MTSLIPLLLGRPVRWAIVAAWVGAALALAQFGSKLADVTNDEYVLPGGSQTAQLQAVLRGRFPDGDQRLVLLVYRREEGLTDADERRILADAEAAAELTGAARPLPPFAADSPPNLVSEDRDVALTIVPLVAGEVFQVKEVIEQLRELQSEEPGLETHVTGFPALIADVNSAIKEADLTLLGVTIALVLVLLVAVYRSPVLAILPLLVVGLAYVVSAGIVYQLNQHQGLPVDSTATSLLLVLMFGAGTDYCLLLIARYRSELRTHERPDAAMAAALGEAGPAIVASGLTVIAALLVMLAAVFGLNRTLGPVNAIGVAVVLLASLTLLPAALVTLGRRAFWPNTASVASGGPGRPEGGSAGGLWYRLAAAVQRRPAAWLTASTAALAVAATGIVLYDDALSPMEQFRSSTDGTRGVEVVRSSFPPGAVAPTSVLVERLDGTVRPADVDAVSARLSSVEGVATVTDTGRRSGDGRAAVLSTVFSDDPFGDLALDRVRRLRAEAQGVDPGLRVLIGQGSGERFDYAEGANRDRRVVAPLVLTVVFLTLVLLLRAVVAPLYLLATVVLSFLATMGAALFIFEVVLGRNDIDPSIPLVVFLFLVALGSDYNIFLMSRVRKDALVYGTREGMFRGLVATGPVITSAGLVLAGTFSVLVVLPVYALIEIGFLVSLGVLVDTFLVRSICVPALVWLVGDRSWWPSRLAARMVPEPVAPVAAEPVLRSAVEPAAATAAADLTAAPLIRPQPRPRTGRPSAPVLGGVFVLRIADRRLDSEAIPVHGPLTLGRDPASDVALTHDQLVSARHARLLPRRDGVLVEDLGSRNGTYVDGVPLGDPVVVRPGSWILVGETTVDVDVVESPGYVLAFVDAATLGRTLTIVHPLVVGRDPDADIALVGVEDVAPRHARLTPSAAGVLVEDLDSPAGTYVGGSLVTRPMLARVGDRVVMGSAILEIRPRPETVYALQVVEGPGAGRSLLVERAVEFGRGPSAGFLLEDDELVSRLHARVTPVPEGLLVEDLGSRNGTVVNGTQILEPTHVGLGGLVRVGDTTLKVVRAEDLNASATVMRGIPESR